MSNDDAGATGSTAPAARRPVGTALRRAVPPFAIGALLVLLGRPAGGVLLAASLLLFVVGLAAPAAGRAFDHGLARVAGAVVRAISVVVGGVLGLLVAPASGVLWLVRWDPLTRSARGARPGWQIASDPVPSGRSYLRERPPRGTGRRLHAAGASLALVAMVVPVALVVVRSESKPAGTSATSFTPFVFADEPWIGELKTEFDVTGLDYDAIAQWRTESHTGRYLNTADGIRRTYQPEAGGPEVWMFGGSTLYGYGQRDDHTIASMLAKRAEADGHPIRITNFGTSAYVNWQETMILANRLAAGGRPDLIVFYDGANELMLSQWRADAGDARPDDPSVVFYKEISQKLDQPQGGSSPPADRETAGRRAAAIYGRGVDVARRLAESYGIPIVHVWQPSLWTKRPWSPADRRAIAALHQDIRQSYVHETADAANGELPEGVIDLSASLDDETQPMFYDLVHTNERGAREVADALYPPLKPYIEEAGR